MNKIQYVMISSCDGVKWGSAYADLEMTLQAACEEIFGELLDDGSDNFSEWSAIEKSLVEDGYIKFEDGSIQIAEVTANESKRIAEFHANGQGG